MRRAGLWISLFLGLISLALLWCSLLLDRGVLPLGVGRMKNVEAAPAALLGDVPVTPAPAVRLPAPRHSMPPASAPELDAPVITPPPLPDGSVIRSTTIRGGLQVKNESPYDLDVAAILDGGSQVSLPAKGVQILIIHTHSSEAYTPAGLDRYDASDSNRTEDPKYNIIRVGDELAAIYEQAGLCVIHDRGVYDYPSYTGSYGRSGEAIEQYLADHPEIAIVLDLHRDALGDGEVVYKIMAEEHGVVASQVMLLCGSDASGLEHPNWRSNLSLALYLQAAVEEHYPSLMRPVALVPQRYNQHLTGGSLIVEVGSSGNTLQEALAAIRLFGETTAPALLALIEP